MKVFKTLITSSFTGVPIICHSSKQANVLKKMADKLDIQIPEPMVSEKEKGLRPSIIIIEDGGLIDDGKQ